MESLKQEILTEMRREIQQMKLEIIEGIKIYSNHKVKWWFIMRSIEISTQTPK